jgi:hypothetical protein
MLACSQSSQVRVHDFARPESFISTFNESIIEDAALRAMRLLGLHHTCARDAMIPNPAIYPAKTAGFEAVRKKHLIAAKRQRDRKGRASPALFA